MVNTEILQSRSVAFGSLPPQHAKSARVGDPGLALLQDDKGRRKPGGAAEAGAPSKQIRVRIRASLQRCCGMKKRMPL